ncbi:hypothetical protein Clacol_010315 [Clathrus columnatus]|uniref:F-box domain-containing protein n=1 Tax=Clathrus columnatus TaxID=1419009 RepID=A0AAV5AN10_9AGAM|nr:hypothetical protein Clacol_010315 [Clathrus columnatus]
MALITELDAINKKVKKALKGTVVDTSTGAQDQHKIIEQAIIDYSKDTVDYLTKLKIHLNLLVFINWIPVELFTRIILLTNSGKRDNFSKYIPYTRVCHHWRSVLVQTANFWTSIQLDLMGMRPRIHPSIHEVLKHSISAKLDLEIRVNVGSAHFILSIENILLQVSHRIHTLRLVAPADMAEVMVGKKPFPLLRRVLYHPIYDLRQDTGLGLLPIIISSDHLDVFEFELRVPMDVLNQLAPVFTHLSALILHAYSTDILRSVLGILHNNAQLRILKLTTYALNLLTFSHLTKLPELWFLSISDISLLENFHVPKLTSLNVRSHSLVTVDNPIHQKFNLSSIKHLQVCYPFTILGLTKPIYPESGFKDVDDEASFMRDVADSYDYDYEDLCDFQSSNYFRLTFNTRALVFQTLEEGFLSRFPGLLELYLGSEMMSEEYFINFSFEKMLSQAPSLEKLIVPYGDSLLDLLRLFTDPSLCPRLSYISYATSDLYLREYGEPENLAEDVGKLLTECVQSRLKIHGNTFKYVILRDCPPIPDNCLWELQWLGTTSIIINNMRESEDEDSSSSD